MTLPASITFISAGAGSGKTYRLTQMLLERLRAGTAAPAGVIATTFTNKAANELRERVQTDLLKAGEHAYAQAIGQSRIGTVNSVCGALVQRFSFELGLPPVLQVLDEAAADGQVSEAIDAALDLATMERIGVIATRFGLKAEDWQGDLGELIDQARANAIEAGRLTGMGARNADEFLAQCPPATREDLDVAMRQAIAVLLPELRAALQKPKPVKKTRDFLDLVQEFDRHLEHGQAAWSEWIKLSKQEPEAGLRPAIRAVAELAGRVVSHPRLQSDLREYLALLFGACADVLRIYAARKRELGVIDFTDQECLLLEALDIPSVREVLAEELQLLMVDEFQDTSPIQLALFVKLAALARESIWVGDVKQAIYGFRGTDASLMLAVLDALPAAGARKEILGHSWRSRPSLVTLTNAVFTQAFADVLQRPEIELSPKRQQTGGLLTFANWKLDGGNKGQQQRALALGLRELIASGHEVEEVASGHSRPARYGDIAVLARGNDTVQEIAATLRSAGIPVATMQPGLLEQPEAILALACLRRVYDRADTVATAEILALADCADPEAWLADRLDFLRNGGESHAWRESGPDAHPLLQRLAALRSELILISPREALQLVIVQCGLAERVLRWSNDDGVARSRLANLDRLIEFAREYEDVCRSRRLVGTIAGLLLWLEAQAAEQEDHIAEPALDAVKVLTHHGAKGLEWPIVVLTDLSKDIRTRLWSITTVSETAVDVDAPLQGRFIRFWPWPFGRQETCDFADQMQASTAGQAWQRRAVAEEIRLLYVSMTRARDLLVLARPSKNPTGAWIDALGAPWLLPADGTEELELPGGAKIRCATRALACDWPDAATDEKPLLLWLQPWASPVQRLPLLVSPSLSAPVACDIGQFERVGTRIPLRKGVDVTEVGTAIHVAIAGSVASPHGPLALPDIESLLDTADLRGKVEAGHIARQITALLDWLNDRWPGHRRHAELPVESVLDNGQVLRGQVDLLLELETGWVLIDHKSGPASAEAWHEAAAQYSGQLAAYAAAIERASGKPVLENWLFLPVAGGAVRVGFRPGSR